LVLFTGPPSLVQENKTVPAILNAWFAGSEAGNASLTFCLETKILGKLTATFQEV
jgi:beta-glucosidase